VEAVADDGVSAGDQRQGACDSLSVHVSDPIITDTQFEYHHSDMPWLSLFVALIFGVALSAQVPDLTLLAPRAGASVPEFAAVDQFGRAQTLQTLMRREGLMLVFFRSADW